MAQLLDKSQQAIVESTHPKICVIAGAGSGKTRTLVERVRYLLKNGADPRQFVCITFTKMAAQEMKARLSDIPYSNKMFIGTIHSLAYKVMARNGEVPILLTPQKEREIARMLISKYGKHVTPELYDEWCNKRRLVELGYLKKHETENLLDEEQSFELFKLLDVKNPADMFESGDTESINKLSEKILNYERSAKTSSDYPETVTSYAASHGIITFNSLLEECKKFFGKGTIKYLFVDEFQDIGLFEYRFLTALNAENVFVVGDDYQCQPAGTKVTMINGAQRAIEKLKEGDYVTTYCSKYNHFIADSTKRRCSKPQQIESISKYVANELFEVRLASGNRSSYTCNHRCYAKFNPFGNRSKSLLYMLKNADGQFRLGVCKAFYEVGPTSVTGIRNRLNKYEGSEGWILDVFNTSHEAKTKMREISTQYCIPINSWQAENAPYINKPISSIEDRAIDCLSYYNRKYDYPFIVHNDSRKFSKHILFEIEACNLIPHLMEMVVHSHNTAVTSPITSITVLEGEFDVYGLDVSTYHNYVADGIVTHNSIYAFKGADFEYFKKLANSEEFHTYKLEANYRSSKKIVNYSNELIAKIDDVLHKNCVSKSGNDLGSTIIKDTGHLNTVEKYIHYIDPRDYGKWFFLTRSNDDAVDLSRLCYRLNVPSITFKKSSLSKEELDEAMAANAIKILTVHASKGLESENVLLYGKFPSDASKAYWIDQGSEECRVMYVGVTRAKRNLVIVDTSNNNYEK